MKFLQTLLNKFQKPTPTNYPLQQLSNKQLLLLEDLDVFFSTHCGSMGPNLSIKSFKLSLRDQLLHSDRIIEQMKPLDGYYIPRSIALVTDNDGNWCFYYGVRSNDTPHEIANELFIDALSRTNTARTQ